MSTHEFRFDPISGNNNPTMRDPIKFREWFGKVVFIYNPYTGKLRDRRDIDSDPYGFLIVDSGEVLKSAF